jgi:hypothetical protein
MSQPDFYAIKQGDVFTQIHPGLGLIRMCGEGPFYKVNLREVIEGEKSNYWAWQETGKERFMWPQPSKIQIDMCFPYGPEIEIKQGKGRLVNIIVEEIEKIEK